MRLFKTTYKDRQGVTQEAAKWYVEFRDQHRKPRRLPAFADKHASAELGRKVEALAAFRASGKEPDPTLARWLETVPAGLRGRLARWGILDARSVAAAKPLDEHLRDFRAALLAKGNTGRHAELVEARARRVVEGCAFGQWSDISASKIMEYLAGLRADRVHCTKAVLKRLSGAREVGPGRHVAYCPVHQGAPVPADEPALGITVERDGRAAVHCRDGCDAVETYAALGCMRRGIGAQTSNFYLGAVKQFCRWMVRDGRAGASPVTHLDGLNVRTDRRHDRRALTVDEIRRLLTAAAKGPERYGMIGAARAMLYRVAVETGLREAELRSLTGASFDLDRGAPTVTVAAAYSKHRREDRLPLRTGTAAALGAFLAKKAMREPLSLHPAEGDGAAPVFDVPDRQFVIRMLRADLAAAGIPYTDDAGKYADFHALRHSFITNLANSGVHPKTAQALARHSTIGLTMDRYTHSVLGDQTAAVEGLPDVSTPAPEAARATGTDDATAAATPAVLASCLALKGGVTPDRSRRNQSESLESAAETHGEVSERPKEPVFKTGGRPRPCGCKSRRRHIILGLCRKWQTDPFWKRVSRQTRRGSNPRSPTTL